MLAIDGSFGEGGGQILRTSLALSLVTGTPFRMINVRSKREKPGLRRQHLTAVRAAAQVGSAQVDGAAVNSREIVFRPGKVRGGQYRFDVGTAGSTTLVFQTVLPALLACGEPADLEFAGGTHNHGGPPWDFLDVVFLPAIRRMGANVSARLDRVGFAPSGGGQWSAVVRPSKLSRFEAHERGDGTWRKARALVSNLPVSVAERELAVVRAKLGWTDDVLSAETVDAFGPGNIVMVAGGFASGAAELATGFGRRGYPAEKVAADAVRCWLADETAGVPVGEHLADQLLLPLALGEGGSFTTGAPSAHTTTNIQTIAAFLDARFRIESVREDAYRIERE